MSVESINEPGNSRVVSHYPPSINEPPTLPPELAPVVTSLDPNTAACGDPDVTLEVHGQNFYSGSVIFFAGHEEPTTFDEAAGTVSTLLKPSLWTSPVVVKCSVFSRETQSNEFDFSFTEAVVPLKAKEHHAHAADPDELEEEIAEAEDDDEFQPTHRGRVTKTLPHKRKK